MTNHSLFAGNGPAAGIGPGTGPFLAGVVIKVTQGGCFLTAYRHWVPATASDTTARKFALWAISGAGTGVHLPAGDVMSGVLTAGAWNVVPLASPVPLAIGMAYVLATGWNVVGGFPDSDTGGAGLGAADSFGTGGHVNGITSGPLFAFSDQAGGGGLAPEPFGTGQGLFSVAGSDPTAMMPNGVSNSGNFYMDGVISDTTPPGYSGTYRLWPNSVVASASTVADSTVTDDVATRVTLSQKFAVSRVWYWSPPGVTQLATAVSIYAVTGGGLTGTLAYNNAAPAWSGAAGSGWISCPVAVTLPPGTYSVGVYNGSAAEATGKDSQLDYWRTGPGGNGITWGPLTAPSLAAAPLAWTYNGNPAGNPPYSDGTTQKGQPVFSQGPPDQYQYLFAPVATPSPGSTQVYWMDLEGLPVAGGLPECCVMAAL